MACVFGSTFSGIQHLGLWRVWSISVIGTGSGAFEESDGELATESVVFLAVGVLGHWKAPVAYFFVNKLSAAVQSGLVKDCLIEFSNVGLCVEAIVMDGLSTNVG